MIRAPESPVLNLEMPLRATELKKKCLPKAFFFQGQSVALDWSLAQRQTNSLKQQAN